MQNMYISVFLYCRLGSVINSSSLSFLQRNVLRSSDNKVSQTMQITGRINLQQVLNQKQKVTNQLESDEVSEKVM